MAINKLQNINLCRGFRLFFWLSFISILFGSLFLYLEGIFIKQISGADRGLTLTVFFLLQFFCWVPLCLYNNPYRTIKKQKIHNQYSWVFYCCFGIFLAPILASLIWHFRIFSLLNIYEPNFIIFSKTILKKILEVRLMGDYVKYSRENIFYSALIQRSFLLLFWLYFYKKIKPLDVSQEEWRFAYGSVGLNQDQLGFKTSAKNIGENIYDLPNWVNVLTIDGAMGSGKSSYCRMIIENLKKEKNLYSYISLTEAGEAKDFSKLFVERWFETLGNRYPHINIDSFFPVMNSILRENNNDIFSKLFSLLAKINYGLIKTKVKVFNKKRNEKNNNNHVNNVVAKLFGNIPTIKEDYWFIVIDEIERAPLDEIYKLIEIIERFKNASWENGLPIKLFFILCISSDDLRDTLSFFQNKDIRAHIIKNFIFERSRKNISSTLFLPPVPRIIKKNYIIKNLRDVMRKAKIKKLSEIKNIFPSSIQKPNDRFLNNEDALNYILGLLMDEPPRTIIRTLQELEFFAISFKDKRGLAATNAIRISDLLALSYIKVKYPFIIKFFVKTISGLLERSGMHRWLLSRELKDDKKRLFDWVAMEVDPRKVNKDLIEKLIGLVAHFYIDITNDIEITVASDYEIYYQSTSDIATLNDWLLISSGKTDVNYRKNYQIYLKHKNEKKKNK